VTLYSAPGYRGMSRTFTSAATNLARHGFNDHARSIRVAGVGRWLLCADANYRGRCITVTRSISDLRHHGLNGSVSSLRRQ
jgi:hypothetical protein